MKRLKWLVPLLAMETMVLEPLALAKELENSNLAYTHEAVSELGFSGPAKAKNMGEMWRRARENFPPEQRKKYDQVAALYADEPLPQVSIHEIVGRGQGDEVKLSMTFGTETISVELSDRPGVLAKVNGTVINDDEFALSGKAAVQISENPYFRNLAKKKLDSLSSRSIIPTYEEYKKMNAVDWAHYKMHIAGLLVSTEAVQNELDLGHQSKKRNGAANDYRSQEQSQQDLRKEALLRWLFGEEARGVETSKAKPGGGKPAAKARRPTRKGAGKKGPWDGECVVAGYVSKYVTDSTGTYCSSETQNINLLGDNLTQSLFEKHKAESCKDGPKSFPCNNRFFLAEKTGGPVCVDVERGEPGRTVTQRCEENSAKGTDMVKLLIKQHGVEEELLSGDQSKDKDAYNKLFGILQPIAVLLERTIRACENRPGEPGQDSACDTLRKKLNVIKAFLKAGNWAKKDPETPVVTVADKTCDKGTEAKPEVVVAKCDDNAFVGPPVPDGFKPEEDTLKCFGHHIAWCASPLLLIAALKKKKKKKKNAPLACVPGSKDPNCPQPPKPLCTPGSKDPNCPQPPPPKPPEPPPALDCTKTPSDPKCPPPPKPPDPPPLDCSKIPRDPKCGEGGSREFTPGAR